MPSLDQLAAAPAAYLKTIRINSERVGDASAYPWNLAFARGLQLELTKAVTFFVGENGSGKSTLLESLVSMQRLPVGGGTRNELGGGHAPEQELPLVDALQRGMVAHPPDASFFRAENVAHFASLVDARGRFERYGGRSLHERSHGEAFLEIVRGTVGDGLYFMDEPESALSPQRQLTLMSTMAQHVLGGATQFVIATHSPILMTFPGATILEFSSDGVHEVALEDTEHYQITRGVLTLPGSYWRHLLPEE